MKISLFLAVFSAFAASVNAADAVQGAAEGFAKGVTGGGDATPVYPKTNAELVEYLADPLPRVIVLNKIFDFIGTEGKVRGSGCIPWGPGPKCQIAINRYNWCNLYEPKAPKVQSLTYDKAGVVGIPVSSNKTLIGQGTSGVIKGKGLRIFNAQNVIIQNILISDINAGFVWGGDAIALDNTDFIWLDHITTVRISRQHIVLGLGSCGHVTISNCKIDGTTPWSATCDGHTWWAIYLSGSHDFVTMKGNLVTNTSGRSPKVISQTVLHAVNNFFDSNTHHALESDTGAIVIAEANHYHDVVRAMQPDLHGKVFSASNDISNAACKTIIGRGCVQNTYHSTSPLTGDDVGLLASMLDKNVAAAESLEYTMNVVNTAGHGKI